MGSTSCWIGKAILIKFYRVFRLVFSATTLLNAAHFDFDNALLADVSAALARQMCDDPAEWLRFVINKFLLSQTSTCPSKVVKLSILSAGVRTISDIHTIPRLQFFSVIVLLRTSSTEEALQGAVTASEEQEDVKEQLSAEERRMPEGTGEPTVTSRDCAGE